MKEMKEMRGMREVTKMREMRATQVLGKPKTERDMTDMAWMSKRDERETRGDSERERERTKTRDETREFDKEEGQTQQRVIRGT